MADEPEPLDPITTEVVKATAGPITEGGQKLLGTVFGGAASELGAYFKDQVTLWRAGRGIYTVDRAAEMLRSAGLEPRPLKMKPLLTIMEGATVEEEESLSEMWAALLANASVEDLRGAESSFAGILRQLSTTDATVLQAVAVFRDPSVPTEGRFATLYAEELGQPSQDVFGRGANKAYAGSKIPELDRLSAVPPSDLKVSADNLVRLGLLIDLSTRKMTVEDSQSLSAYFGGRLDVRSLGDLFPPLDDSPRVDIPVQTRERVDLTNLGLAFMRACAPPGRPESGE